MTSKMALSCPYFPLQEKAESSSVSPGSSAPVRLPTARFETFRLKSTDKTMGNISTCYVHKALDSIAGKVNGA